MGWVIGMAHFVVCNRVSFRDISCNFGFWGFLRVFKVFWGLIEIFCAILCCLALFGDDCLDNLALF